MGSMGVRMSYDAPTEKPKVKEPKTSITAAWPKAPKAGFLRKNSREKLKAMSAKAYAYTRFDLLDNEVEIRPTSRWQTVLRKGKLVPTTITTSNGKKIPGKAHEQLSLLEVCRDMQRRIEAAALAKIPKLPKDIVNFGEGYEPTD